MAIIVGDTTTKDRSRLPDLTTDPVSAQVEFSASDKVMKALGIVRAEAATREVVMELWSDGRLLDSVSISLRAGESKRISVAASRVGQHTNVQMLHAGELLCVAGV